MALRILAASAMAFSPSSRSGFSRVVPQLVPRAHAMTTMSVTQQVDDLISSNDVMIFSKSYCPFCAQTKTAFKDMGVAAKIMELDLEKDGDAIQAELLSKTGQKTVPNVFVKGQHVGGNDDTQKAKASGKLAEMLK